MIRYIRPLKRDLLGGSGLTAESETFDGDLVLITGLQGDVVA